MNNHIQVAIVDDHKIIADGLERLINESETTSVIGKAYSVAGYWELLKDKQPDVLLLDISMPDGNGIDLCPKIKANKLRRTCFHHPRFGCRGRRLCFEKFPA
ncbi:response regulator transcription factor [Dysgonomonas reticulitermitis]